MITEDIDPTYLIVGDRISLDGMSIGRWLILKIEMVPVPQIEFSGDDYNLSYYLVTVTDGGTVSKQGALRVQQALLHPDFLVRRYRK